VKSGWPATVTRVRPILEMAVVTAWLSGSELLLLGVDADVWRQSLAASLALLYVADLVVLGIGLSTYFLFLAIAWPALAFLLFAPYGQSQPLGHSWTLFLSSESLMVTGYLLAYLLSARVFAALNMSADSLDSKILGSTPAAVIDRVSTDALSIMAMVAAYIYQPTMPGAQYTELDYNLFAGNAWNYICLGSYFFVIFGDRQSFLRRVAFVCVPLWLILHFDRGELTGLLFFGLTAVFNRRSNDTTRSTGWRKRTLAIGLAVIVVVAFTYLGYARLTGMYWSTEVFRGAMLSIINLSTVQQVNHSFAAAVEWWTRFGEYLFVADYPLRLIPSFLAVHPQSAENFVADVMLTNYGMPFQGEALLSFGLAGFLLAPIVIPCLFKLSIYTYGYALGPLGSTFAFYLVSLLVVRVGWYGVFYLPKVMLTVAPLVWICFAATRLFQRWVARTHSQRA